MPLYWPTGLPFAQHGLIVNRRTVVISDTGNKADRLGLVVIGNRMVGHRFCAELVARVGHQQHRIHVLCQEPCLAYDRIGRSPYFSGASIDDLMLGHIESIRPHRIYSAGLDQFRHPH